MRFEWDPGKDAVNLAKHGMSFELALRAPNGMNTRDKSPARKARPPFAKGGGRGDFRRDGIHRRTFC